MKTIIIILLSHSIAYKYKKIVQNLYRIENYVYDNNVGAYLNMFLIVPTQIISIIKYNIYKITKIHLFRVCFYDNVKLNNIGTPESIAIEIKV